MAAIVLAHREFKCRVSPDEPALTESAGDVAAATGRPARALLLQGLLQLPRIADEAGLVRISLGEVLLTELAEELPVSAEWFVPGVGTSPRSLNFHEVGEVETSDAMRRFHYLHSPRKGGRAYGLSTTKGRLVAMCVSSTLDVQHLRDLLVANGRPAERARTISRVFAFESAPENSISYLLSRAASAERRLGVADLVTYVNPNMGFTGTSYRASGWQLLGEEPGTTYRYLDERYITDRELAARFGQHDDETYRQKLDDRFAVNTMPLAPLLIFHRRLVE